MSEPITSLVPAGLREGLQEAQRAEQLREVADLCEQWAVVKPKRQRLSLSARRRIAGVPGVLREMAEEMEQDGRRKAQSAVILSGGS